jgi:putative transposase
MCQILHVSRSGYHSWKAREEVRWKKEAEELKLVRLIEDIHRASRKTYGSPRILAELRGMGVPCDKSRVEKLMKKHGIRSKTKRKFKKTTDSKHNLPVVPNLLNRDFSPIKANRVWASDITYIATREGWLFLAVVIDLYSRQVVGWSMNERMTKELVLSALRMAYFKRKSERGLIFHSDRGSQYCSKEFRAALKAYQMIQSQSRKGDCWDNSVVESFFHSLKTEFIFDEDFKTRNEAIAKIFEWMEVFYNRQRRHSTLGQQSPVEFERATC